MNKVILMGRLTRDPDVRYTNGQDPMEIARFTLAVNRRTRKDGEQNADFISCVAFGKAAEHAEKYYKKDYRLQFLAGFRQEAIQIVKEDGCIQPIL